jgi:hypothetical protein
MSTEYIGIHKGLQKALDVVSDKEGKKAIRQAIREHREGRYPPAVVRKKSALVKKPPVTPTSPEKKKGK